VWKKINYLFNLKWSSGCPPWSLFYNYLTWRSGEGAGEKHKPDEKKRIKRFLRD